jgi:hypothetical protein
MTFKESIVVPWNGDAYSLGPTKTVRLKQLDTPVVVISDHITPKLLCLVF